MSELTRGLLRALCAAAILTSLLFSHAALAQDADQPAASNKLALVINPESRGVSHEEARNIAGLVEDEIAGTHKFQVVSHADITAALAKTENIRAPGCGQNRACLQKVWKPIGIDYVATLLIVREGRETVLTLTLVTIESGAAVVSHVAVLGGTSLVAGAEMIAKTIAASQDGERPPSEPQLDLPSRLPVQQDPSARRTAQPLSPDEISYERKRLEFVSGVELGFGVWSMDPARIIAGANNGFDFTRYAPAFTAPFDGQVRPAMNLHVGWTFLGAGAIEAAVHASAWDGSTTTRDGAIMAGVLGSLYPFQIVWPDRRFELGLQVGGGYAFVGGPFYDMDGTYFTVGATGEWYLNRWLSLEAFYRLYTPFLTKFYIDYSSNRTEPVAGFTAYWNTFGVGANVHFGMIE